MLKANSECPRSMNIDVFEKNFFVHPIFQKIWRGGNAFFWNIFGLGLSAR